MVMTEQLQLVVVPPHLELDGYEVALTGASNLEGGDTLQVDDEIRVTVTDANGERICTTLGQVTEIRVVKRREPGAAGREFLVRRAIIKV